MMDRADFERLMTELFDYLEEYYPRLEHAPLRQLVAENIWRQGVEDTGDTQAIYQYLRDRVESMLVNLKAPPGPFDWDPEEQS